MAYKREGLPAYVLEYFHKKLLNPFAVFRPFLYFMGLKSVESMTKLGRPNTPAVFGDLSQLGRGELRRLTRSTEHYFGYQKWEPDDGETIAHQSDETPTASTWSEDNAGQAATKWTHFMEPIKISKSALDDATGASAIMNLMDNATSITWESLLKRVNDQMINGSIAQAGQDLTRWSEMLGISHVLTTNNYYGQVDRSAETDLNPINIAAATDLDSTGVELELCDIVNDGNANITGRAGKSPDGSGCNLHMVHPTLFAPLRREAKGTYQIHVNGIPGHAAVGHRRPVIEYGNNWIVYDRGIPTDEMWSLRLESWMLEIDSRYNFVPQPFKLKSEQEEGGGHYEWSQLHAKMRLTCREPWLQVKTTGLTAA